MRIALDEVCNLSQIAPPREISQIACIFTFQWVRFSFGGNFENNFFLLLFCKKNSVMKFCVFLRLLRLLYILYI